MFKVNTNLKYSYLSFRVGSELLALDSEIVRNILDIKYVHENTKNGIIKGNNEVTILDLRKMMGSNDVRNNENTCAIILEMVDSSFQFVGILVDEVVSLVDFHTSQILLPAETNSKSLGDFIEGIVRSVRPIIKILNINRLVSFAYNENKSQMNNKVKLVLG